MKVRSFDHSTIRNLAKPLNPIRRNELGFTMIEIMIALAIASILVIAIYNLYISQSKTYIVQEQVSDMQQNARVAMDILSRHIRMAEFGQPIWTTINGTAGITYRGINVTDGGSGNPDTLEIVGCLDSPASTLDSAASSGSTVLTLQSSSEADKFNTTTKSDILIGERENAKVEAKVWKWLFIDTDPDQGGWQGLSTAYPAGTNLYIVKRVTYTIDSATLKRNENTGSGNEEVALNVENLQVTYTEPVTNLSITARTRNEDGDYTHPTEGDGYRRMTLTSNVIARNLE